MKTKPQFVLLLGCLTFLFAGCGPPPRKAALEFKTRIEASLQATNSVEAVTALKEMLQYIENMRLKDQGEFFSAWPEGRDGCKAWIGEVKSKLEKMEKEKQ